MKNVVIYHSILSYLYDIEDTIFGHPRLKEVVKHEKLNNVKIGYSLIK